MKSLPFQLDKSMPLPHWLLMAALLLPLLVQPAAAHDEYDDADTEAEEPKLDYKVSDKVYARLDEKGLDPATRRQIKLFHGLWDELEDLTPEERAFIALLRYKLDDDIWRHDEVPVVMKAEAALLRGRPESTLELLKDDTSGRACILKARALEQLNRTDEIAALLKPWRIKMLTGRLGDARSATAIAEAVAMLAELNGGPAGEFHMANNTLDNYYGDDPLYWPTALAQANLLVNKDNRPEAAELAEEVISLNLHCSEAYALLGRLTARGFAFRQAQLYADKLREINREHLLADVVETHMYLVQRDTAGARAVVERGLARHPRHRELIALLGATEALAGNERAFRTVERVWNELSPGHPQLYTLSGAYLSLARQYPEAGRLLRQAIERRPRWAQPRLLLALMLMQAGDEKAALVELKKAYELDPFNRRVFNSLELAEELVEYQQIETDHFIVRWKDPIDRVLAMDIAAEGDAIHQRVTEAFSFTPQRKTVVELLPDVSVFAVRITGLPDTWTIAACTGDVLAMVPPRHGPKLPGSYDWYTVLSHEFVHTVTLNQTAFRIPHWYTEGCAQTQEIPVRDQRTAMIIAAAYHGNRLFAYDDITWGFVRPEQPLDRALAYAQAHLMHDYIIEEYGRDAMLRLFDSYRRNMDEDDAMRQVLKKEPRQFMESFGKWTHQKLKAWGLAKPEDETLRELLEGDDAVTGERLSKLLSQFPENPSLLRMRAEELLAGDDRVAARTALQAYAKARRFDLWPHKHLVQLAIEDRRPYEAIDSLRFLDDHAKDTGRFAQKLAFLYRMTGRPKEAYYAIRRALHREPYNTQYREFAAAIAAQQGLTEDVVRHVTALTILEPNDPGHFDRLAQLLKEQGREEEAKQAADTAERLRAQGDE